MEIPNELEQQLQNVRVPEDLLSRLKRIPDQEAAISNSLANVPLPKDLLSELHALPETATRPTRYVLTSAMGWVLAASMLIAVGIGAYGFLDSSNDPIALDFSKDLAHFASSEDEPIEWIGPTPSLGTITEFPTRIDFAIELEEPTWNVPKPAENVQTISTLADQLPSDLLANTFLMRWQPLGANPVRESLPLDPIVVATPQDSIPYFPTSIHYDRDLLLRSSEHPFANPKLPGLGKLSLPISSSCQSFEQYVASGPWTKTQWKQARIEDWLSATGRFFQPVAPGTLAIQASGGPAVFASPEISMLQIGVVAGAPATTNRPPTHLTVGISPPSTSLKDDADWQITRLAIRELIGQLAPKDSVTLVLMGRIPTVVAEGFQRKDQRRWLEQIEAIQPQRTSNIADGIRFATAVALTQPIENNARRPVLILSNDCANLQNVGAGRLRPMLESATADRIEFSWVQLENRIYAELSPQPDYLQGLGDWSVSDSLRDVHRIAQNVIHNQSTLVASSANVSITWEDKSVNQFRLMGHQPNGDGLSESASGFEIHAGESASLLFELKLPKSGRNQIAKVQLSWIDGFGKKHRSEQQILRRQFADSWENSGAALQVAQITAQSLLLRQSAYSTKVRGISAKDLFTWSRRLDSAVKTHPSFARVGYILPSS